jgi:hypothetical protein
MSFSSLIEEYEEYERPLRHWVVRIIAYKLGEKYICIVNNVDPGATISRVSAKTRLDALKSGLQQANTLLTNTPMLSVPAACKPRCLASIEYTNGNGNESYPIDEFLQLPLEFRTQSLVQNKLVFRDPAGEELPRGEALQLLSAACA